MSKIAIVGDLHYGSYDKNSDKYEIIRTSQKSFEDFLVDELNKRGIKRIIQTGDVWDKRYTTSNVTVQDVTDFLTIKLASFSIDIITGNHDLYYNDSFKVSMLSPLKYIGNITVHEKPSNIMVDGKRIAMLPWIIDSSYDETMEIVRSKPDVCIGHLELSDIDMGRGRMSTSHINNDEFLSNCKLTLSGHFHHISKTSRHDHKIIYVGSPFHLNYDDAGMARGFWILDTDDCSVEFIKNPVSAEFLSIKSDAINEWDNFSNKVVKITIPAGMSYNDVNNITNNVASKGPLKYEVISERVQQDTVEVEQEQAQVNTDVVSMAKTWYNSIGVGEPEAARAIKILEKIRKEMELI